MELLTKASWSDEVTQREKDNLQVAYPFGFGLSYTKFALGCAGVSAEGTKVKVQCMVTNTDTTHSGKEVVQFYVSAPNGKLCKVCVVCGGSTANCCPISRI